MSGSTTEQAGPHNVLPPATITPTIEQAQRASLSEITALLNEMRVLLRHVLHRKNQNVHLPGTTHPDGQSASPLKNVHVELLTKAPEEIACDEELLRKLCSSVEALTACAAPASLSSIYLTSAFLHDEMSPTASDAAKLAARRLRCWAIVTVLIAVTCFVATLMLLIHVDRGRRQIQQLTLLQNEYQQAIAAIDQTHDPNLLADCTKGLPGSRASGGQPWVSYQNLCDRLRKASQDIEIVRTGLGRWNTISYRLAYLMPIRWFGGPDAPSTGVSMAEWESSEFRASAVMEGFTGFVLPMMLGLLGAFTYVYRDLDRRVRNATLLPEDSMHGSLRMLLGTILAGLLGVLWTDGQPIKLEGVTLSLSALAFFVGYSVEVVFRLLDTVVIKAASALGK